MRNTLHTILSSVVGFVLSACGTVHYSQAPLPDAPKKIALIVPLNGSYASAGKAVRDGFFTAYYDAMQQGQTAASIQVYDSSKSSVKSLYHEAVENGAQVVVGPLEKSDLQQLHGNFSEVPVIALNSLAGKHPPNGVYEFALSPQDEAAWVASKAYQDGRRHAIVIYPQSDWGYRVHKNFVNTWRQLGGTVVADFAFKNSDGMSQSIEHLLQTNAKNVTDQPLKTASKKNDVFVPQQRTDADMIFILANPNQARRILPLVRYYSVNNLPTYSISAIYGGVPDRNVYRDMNDVIFCDMPFVIDKQNGHYRNLKASLQKNWPDNYKQNLRLYALGINAYGLTTNLNALIQHPDQTLNGETGLLSLKNQIIYRQLAFAQFKNGLAEPLL